ncbi:MAG: TrmH family RNA methyltransferase [Patescibacteria group bacterium]
MILIAHDIRSLHNVGAIFRSADAFGVEKIYLTGYTGHPPQKEIAKTALGSEHRVPWEENADLPDLLKKLQSKDFLIVALENNVDAIPIDTLKTTKPIVLLLGNETEGIAPEILSLCDEKVEIPMPGTKRSLNVSVATGIALFALASQKQ